MPKNPNFILEVSIRISEAFTLDSIVRCPRTFKPKDVLGACQNNEIVQRSPEVPRSVLSLSTFIMTDFFALAHATGLYNRQKQLWESLSKVTTIHVFQLTTGLMNKKALGIYDLIFQDYKGKPLLVANLVEPDSLKDRSLCLGSLKSFIGRAQRKAGIAGVFASFPSPFPLTVLDFVKGAVNSADPIARYESILPSLHVPINLLEMTAPEGASPEVDEGESDEPTEGLSFQLVHPNLKKNRSAGIAAATK